MVVDRNHDREAAETVEGGVAEGDEPRRPDEQVHAEREQPEDERVAGGQDGAEPGEVGQHPEHDGAGGGQRPEPHRDAARRRGREAVEAIEENDAALRARAGQKDSPSGKTTWTAGH